MMYEMEFIEWRLVSIHPLRWIVKKVWKSVRYLTDDDLILFAFYNLRLNKMRLDKHTPRSLSRSVNVYLDGVKVEDCIEAYVGFGDKETEGLGYIIEPVIDSVNKHGVESLSIDTTKARDAFDYDGLWCTIRMGYVEIDIDEDLRKRLEPSDAKFLQTVTPLPMVLHCPVCHQQHIDNEESEAAFLERSMRHAGEEHNSDSLSATILERWTNPPHKSHLCSICGTIWRPAYIPTTGVKSVTSGSNDNWSPYLSVEETI